MTRPNDPVGRGRLADEAELGALLRRANLEYRAGLDEGSAFERVGERLAEQGALPLPSGNGARQRPRTHVASALGLLCAAAAGWLVWLEVGRGSAPEVLLGPEVSVGEGRQRANEVLDPPRPVSVPEAEAVPLLEPQPEAAREASPQPPRAALARDALREVVPGEGQPAENAHEALETPEGHETAPPEALPSEVLPSEALPSEVLPPKRPHTPRAPDAHGPRNAPPRAAHPVSRPRSTSPIDSQPRPGGASIAPTRPEPSAPAREDCLELARRGEPRGAERCFAQRAAGSGLGAEMALYEMARLRRDVLQDAVGALAALSAYRERFARGSLRNEVDLSRVELLADLGRSADALHESEALLAGGSGRERAAELHLLRGDVYRQKMGDLRAAAAEYAQVEALGGARGAEGSRRLGACLERLGDAAGALAAYRRYLSEPGRPHAAEVRRRIERMSGGASGGGGK